MPDRVRKIGPEVSREVIGHILMRRLELGWSRARLCAEMKDKGYEMTPRTLQNIETGVITPGQAGRQVRLVTSMSCPRSPRHCCWTRKNSVPGTGVMSIHRAKHAKAPQTRFRILLFCILTVLGIPLTVILTWTPQAPEPHPDGLNVLIPVRSIPHPPVTPSSSPGLAHYVVQSGDSIAGIAQSQCKTSDWSRLYAANRNVIGGNPYLLRKGESLVMAC
jgi:hypothetical protein